MASTPFSILKTSYRQYISVFIDTSFYCSRMKTTPILCCAALSGNNNRKKKKKSTGTHNSVRAEESMCFPLSLLLLNLPVSLGQPRLLFKPRPAYVLYQMFRYLIQSEGLTHDLAGMWFRVPVLRARANGCICPSRCQALSALGSRPRSAVPDRVRHASGRNSDSCDRTHAAL